MIFKAIQQIGTRISSQILLHRQQFTINMSPVTSPSKAAPPSSASSSSPPHENVNDIFLSFSPKKRSPSPPPRSKPYLTISVDGNISSGKSTLVSTLLDLLPNDFNYGVEAVPEPLEKWTNVGGHNLLDMLYKDTTKNNFIFQHYVQLTRLTDTLKRCEPPEEGQLGRIRVMERSIQNNRYCFSELARRQGTLHEAEFSVIAEWYKWLEEQAELPLDLIIYLKTSPEVVYERMTSRGRSEESTVPLKYLSDLHNTYEDWLIHGKIQEEDSTIPRKYQVLVIDANKSKQEVAEECRNLIKEFLTKKQNMKMDEEQEPLVEEKSSSPVKNCDGLLSPSPAKKQKLNPDEAT